MTQWAPIRDKVEAWVRSGWKKWEEEKPDWFMDDWKATVPREMIPLRRGGEEEATEVGVGREGVVGIGETQGSRHDSFFGPLMNRPKMNKVEPEVMQAVKKIDNQEFKREMRRKSIKL